MSTRVSWSADAEADLFALPPSEAEEVFEAVERLAATGKGFVRVLIDSSGEYVLS